MSLKSDLAKLKSEYENNRAKLIVDATTQKSFVCGENSLNNIRYSLSVHDLLWLYDAWIVELPNFYPKLAKDKLIIMLEKYTNYNDDIDSIVKFAESLHNDWL